MELIRTKILPSLLRIDLGATRPLLTLLCLVSLLVSSCKEKTLFENLDPSRTGITFENTITESDTFNIINYEYVYNGGGVGIADVNSDGLPDIFFTGNMVNNKLYLNKGNFRFDDITEAAGVAGKSRWSTGVSVVDINQDGLPDLYVSASTYQPGARRANQLFVNQGPGPDGIPRFVDQGAAYGLNDDSHTTSSAFFDYDNDGDLDVYLAINEMDQLLQPNRFREKIDDGSSRRTDKLFRNDGPGPEGHPVFSDVSDEAGIRFEGFSLGLNIVDINEDGWKDIYVTNDFLTNDLMYINNGDGTFTNRASEYFKHTSYSAMGNDVADLNNDGLVDLVAVDMLPEDNFRRKTMMSPNNYTATLNNLRFQYDFQYVRNTLQLNQGMAPGTSHPVFSEIAMLSGIHATDWSWTPSVADFDNDGLRDIIITNGFPKDITDHDFIDYQSEVERFAPVEVLLSKIPSVKLPNVAYKNHGNLKFSNEVKSWGLEEPSFSNGAAYVDLDNDGDLDYVVNNIDGPAFVFRNTRSDKHPKLSHWLQVDLEGPSGNIDGLGASIRLTMENGDLQVLENTPYRGYLSSVDSRLHFGLGEANTVKILEVKWPDGKTQVLEDVEASKVYELSYKDAANQPGKAMATSEPVFEKINQKINLSAVQEEEEFIDFNYQSLLPHKLSQFGPGLAVADVNGDDLPDFYLGGSRGKEGMFFLQQEDGSFKQEQRILPGEGNSEPEELGILFFDADGDGDEDLYLASGSYEWPAGDEAYKDRLYLNEDGYFKLATHALPGIISSGGCVRAADFDRDGDLDLMVAGRVAPEKYPLPVSSYLLRNDSNDGEVRFSEANDELATDLNDLGMVCDALWTDYDNDGWQDLLLVGEWMAPTLLRNQNGRLVKVEGDAGLSQYSGMWTSLVSADFDKDGDMDYVAGNLGYNTLHTASPEHPIRIYADDFDKNGGFDIIPTLYLPVSHENPELKEFPFFNRLDMQKQIIAMKRNYMLHSDFARADIPQLLREGQRDSALVLEAGYMGSSYFENLGDGNFKVSPLPFEAQLAPIYGMLADDFDQDGNEDILLVGNDFGTEVSTGRYDAMNGLWLRGNGDGTFEAESLQRSGFFVPGDARSLVSLPQADGNYLVLAGQNQGELLAFRKNGGNGRFLLAGSLDQVAILSYADGSSKRVEIPYGSSFLSQNSRYLFLDEGVVDVELMDSEGNSRKADLHLATQ